MERSELELAGCLRRLLRSRYVLRSRNERWFKSIVDNRRRLDEIAGSFGAFLEINEALGVTFLRPASEEIEDQLGIRMTRSRTLGPYATALLLHLRWQRLQFYLQPTNNDIPLASAAEMREFLAAFSTSLVDAQFERQFRRCVDELTDLQVIMETASGSGYYEITSLCDLLLPADQIQELRARALAYFNNSGARADAASHGEDNNVG